LHARQHAAHGLLGLRGLGAQRLQAGLRLRSRSANAAALAASSAASASAALFWAAAAINAASVSAARVGTAAPRSSGVSCRRGPPLVTAATRRAGRAAVGATVLAAATLGRVAVAVLTGRTGTGATAGAATGSATGGANTGGSANSVNRRAVLDWQPSTSSTVTKGSSMRVLVNSRKLRSVALGAAGSSARLMTPDCWRTSPK
jgi:hypothetical protein